MEDKEEEKRNSARGGGVLKRDKCGQKVGQMRDKREKGDQQGLQGKALGSGRLGRC
jgi:hypothetical protein